MGRMAIIYQDKICTVYKTEVVKYALLEYISEYSLNCKKPVEIHWSKSDTGNHAVVACSTRRIGVDIELMKPRRFEAISRRYFHEVTDDKETFYNLWCQKEAFTKWKKDKIAHNMKVDIDRCLIPLEGLPNEVVGYICY
tara:strand:- start:509 stop:925 length:417 start_codon:yes stop_codon:yes gene_type:complete